ncbi:uncharacterized protein BDCG_09099 [Blastomyces dermatitidis ER-3]|uniref:Uncharacterized protein n=1 Tax=Ajellomyces dermatitidis (strain ER-3 / ATCC MYA-2586) TaxID=559297 RepID=A0ABP2ET70_AJEDR|nr:uncharacterized protein BDCG_09099 [Blastomyces dermatitidis ER-3]EEQ85830.1 hypothetical protein BDCG_09099 [Blastomyces dermatitidis ER-3]
MGKVTSVGKTTDGKKRREKKTTTDDVVDVGWAKKNFWATTNGPGLSAGTGTVCMVVCWLRKRIDTVLSKTPDFQLAKYAYLRGYLAYQDYSTKIQILVSDWPTNLTRIRTKLRSTPYHNSNNYNNYSTRWCGGAVVDLHHKLIARNQPTIYKSVSCSLSLFSLPQAEKNNLLPLKHETTT